MEPSTTRRIRHARLICVALAGGLALAGGCGSAGAQPAKAPGEPDPAAPVAGALPGTDAIDGPRVRVLGTVQDGGLPHVACACSNCEGARRDPAARRRVASLAIVLPGATQRVVLVDATPDLGDQLHALADVRRPALHGVDRAPIDGVILTHAHIGHYLGLAWLGFEAVNTSELPVYCTPRMAAFLRDNEPWAQLLARRNLALRDLVPDRPLDLGSGVTVEPFGVPHRDELSDTIGLLVRGPRAALAYVPDTDGWTRWPAGALERILDRSTVALLDGTFSSMTELPGRDVRTIGHPLIDDTMDRLEPRVAAGRLVVRFVHLNHSNPALREDGPERAAMRRRGFDVAREGEEFAL
jgi:pyrroloquinoline quinone biosynthesis protein B